LDRLHDPESRSERQYRAAIIENLHHYRAAHEIAIRRNRGQASTEDLRKAMMHYRTLFEELLGEHHEEKRSA